MKKNDIFAKWLGGIAYETAFWNNVYRWPKTFEGMMNWSGYGSVIKLEGFDANAFLATKDNPTVLDVGCGMSYATGNYILKATDGEQTEMPLDIHYVDPLAERFNRILKKYDRKLPEIEFGMVEYLSAFYPNHDIPLIIVQNALDHSARPIKGIYECIDALETGGVLYLNHHENEAETEHYKGFHQYNICEQGGHLVIRNKTERWDVNSLLSGFATIETRRMDNGHITAVITKTAALPDNIIDRDEDRKALCATMIDNAQKATDIIQSVRMRMAYMGYNVVQMVVQGLPWDMKMHIKKIIRQA